MTARGGMTGVAAVPGVLAGLGGLVGAAAGRAVGAWPCDCRLPTRTRPSSTAEIAKPFLAIRCVIEAYQPKFVRVYPGHNGQAILSSGRVSGVDARERRPHAKSRLV